MRAPFGVRYFEKRNPATNESKFWAVKFVPVPGDQRGVGVRLWWGRIGTDGQTKDVPFGTAAEATAYAEERLGEKLSKGYELVESPPDGSPVFKVDATTLRLPTADRKLDSVIEKRPKYIKVLMQPPGNRVGLAPPRRVAVAALKGDRQIDFEE
jgi:predicted DNA-binding WGR domain protein